MLSEAKQNGGQSLGTHHHSVPDLLQFGHLAPLMGVCLCVCILVNMVLTGTQLSDSELVCKLPRSGLHRKVLFFMTSQNTHSWPIMQWDTCMAERVPLGVWVGGGPRVAQAWSFWWAMHKRNQNIWTCHVSSRQSQNPQARTHTFHISHSHISFSQLWPNYRVLSNMNYAFACMRVCVCVCSAQLIFKPITDFD